MKTYVGGWDHDKKAGHGTLEVRKTPSWPRSWPNFTLHSCVPTGMHGPTCIFWANLTPLLARVRGRPALRWRLARGHAARVRPGAQTKSVQSRPKLRDLAQHFD
jgi:hypothetical protein